MQRGRVVECGPTPEVFSSPSDEYARMLSRVAADAGRLELAA